MSATTKPKWWESTLTGFDTETTGINPHGDRIVTAAIVHRVPNRRPSMHEWIIDPGMEVPTEAAEVHGWTRSRVLEVVGGEGQALHTSTTAEGQTRSSVMPREVALSTIAVSLASATAAGHPIVAANAAFDLTLLDAELTRHGIDPMTLRPVIAGKVIDLTVIDPMVIAKQWDPYRKTKTGCTGGKHKCGGCGATDSTLTGLCLHYGVPLTTAHSSTADALAAVRLAVRLGQLWGDAGRLTAKTLHAKQIEWRATQMDGLRSYFDRNQMEHDGCCGEWPLHVSCAPALAVTA